MVDYYKLLEVPKTASPTDIKKAYRRLALKWHPDKNPDKQEVAEKRFKEISEAYEVLSDDKKKRVYDQVGHNNANNGFSGRRPGHRHQSNRRSTGFFYDDFGEASPFDFHFKDPSDVFKEFFRDNSFGDFFKHSTSRRCSDSSFSYSCPPNGKPTNNGNGGPEEPVDPFFRRSSFSHFDDFSAFDIFSKKGNADFDNFSTSFTATSSPSTVRKTSTSTRFVNGKKIETRTVLEKGVETLSVYEDSVLVSKQINGIPQSVSS